MAALCGNVSEQKVRVLDHLIGAGEQGWGND